MRKNKLFIAGLVTVFVALVSLTLVSSTWAKYTSTVEGGDKARVAYWGINKDKSTIEIDLFSAGYDGTVQSNDAAKVIAPGTSQTCSVQFIYFEAKAPEVDYELTISTDGSTIADAIKNNTNIKWQVGTETELTWTEFLAAIEALGDTFEAGSISNISTTIGWKWVYESDPSLDGTDTSMGNSPSDLVVNLVISATATQID